MLKAADGRPAIWFETRGDRSKAPAVLLHGFTGTHRSWDFLAERLLKSHFLILPDLPGHGKSGISPRTAMGVGPTSDAIGEVIKLSRREGSAKKAAMVGYSLGGRIALDLACKHQELLSRLIVEAASPGIENEGDRERRKAQDGALADEVERKGIQWFVDFWQETPILSSQKGLPPETFRRNRRDRLSNSAEALALSLRAAGTGEMAPLWKSIGGLTIPVLLVVGKRDAKYAKIAEAMQRKIQGSVLAEIEGAGHCVHVETPEIFADLVERFLAGRPEMLRAAK